MPLFGNSQANPGTTWEPKAADTRLAHTAGVDPAGIFSSDLSVSEYVLLGGRASSRSASWWARPSTMSASRQAAGRKTRNCRC